MFVPVVHGGTRSSCAVLIHTQHYTSVNAGSLLLHPKTGCEYEDLSTWSLWAGTPCWPLDMDAFSLRAADV